MTWTLAAASPSRSMSWRRPYCECTTTASTRRSRRRWAASWPGRGSRGSRSWAVSTSGRSGSSRSSTHGSPSHWKWTTSAAAPRRARDSAACRARGRRSLVARRSREPAAPRALAVEQLAHRVAVGGGHLAVGKAAGDELHLGAGAGQRRAQRVVIRGRERRRIDDRDAHRPNPARGRRGPRAGGHGPRAGAAEDADAGVGVALQADDRRRDRGQSGTAGRAAAQVGRAAQRMAPEQAHEPDRAGDGAFVLAVVDRQLPGDRAIDGLRPGVASTRAPARVSA